MGVRSYEVAVLSSKSFVFRSIKKPAQQYSGLFCSSGEKAWGPASKIA